MNFELCRDNSGSAQEVPLFLPGPSPGSVTEGSQWRVALRLTVKLYRFGRLTVIRRKFLS